MLGFNPNMHKSRAVLVQFLIALFEFDLVKAMLAVVELVG